MTKSNLTIENYNAVVAAVRANEMVVGNDHNCGTGTYTATGVAALVNGDRVTPVLLVDARYFSLNLLYLDKDGKPRVSRNSVGGVLEPMNNEYKLDKTIQKFNDDQVGNQWTMGSLEHVVVFENELTPR